MKGHTGNIYATVSDRKLQLTGGGGNHGGYVADVQFKADYYPFGMIEPGRNENPTSYRYGMNGMEKENDLVGTGNSYTTYFRQYDPRLGRWKTPDPVIHAWESPYAGFANNPILYVDPEGDEPITISICIGTALHNALYIAGTTALTVAPIVAGATLVSATVSTGQHVSNSVSTLQNGGYYVRDVKTNELIRVSDFGPDSKTSVIQPSEKQPDGSYKPKGEPELVDNSNSITLETEKIIDSDLNTSAASLASILVASISEPTFIGEVIFISYAIYLTSVYGSELIFQAIDLAQAAILEMSKGGKQKNWDNELSPLPLEALDKLYEEAKRNNDKRLKNRIDSEKKRRKLKNKQNRNSRGY